MKWRAVSRRQTKYQARVRPNLHRWRSASSNVRCIRPPVGRLQCRRTVEVRASWRRCCWTADRRVRTCGWCAAWRCYANSMTDLRRCSWWKFPRCSSGRVRSACDRVCVMLFVSARVPLHSDVLLSSAAKECSPYSKPTRLSFVQWSLLIVALRCSNSACYCAVKAASTWLTMVQLWIIIELGILHSEMTVKESVCQISFI